MIGSNFGNEQFHEIVFNGNTSTYRFRDLIASMQRTLLRARYAAVNVGNEQMKLPQFQSTADIYGPRHYFCTSRVTLCLNRERGVFKLLIKVSEMHQYRYNSCWSITNRIQVAHAPSYNFLTVKIAQIVPYCLSS